MTKFTATLTTKGLGNIVRHNPEEDFKFVVGDRRYGCPWFIAAFLSPKISSLLTVDGTLKEFILETVDAQECFGEFLSLGSGCEVAIDDHNQSFMISVSRELCNFELYFSLVNHFEGGPNISNVIERLHIREEFGSRSNSDGCSSPEIEFLASHFHELSNLVLNSLSFAHLHEIFSNGCLQIESEDLLYDFIISRICSDSRYSELLAFVRFDFLSVFSLENFFQAILIRSQL
jgi:hypothetical protein